MYFNSFVALRLTQPTGISKLTIGGNVDHKEAIHQLIKQISIEVLEFIKEEESKRKDKWVPAAHIKNSLDLNFIAVPKAGKQYGVKGWFFAIIARMLEDQDLLKHRKSGNRAYYRST